MGGVHQKVQMCQNGGHFHQEINPFDMRYLNDTIDKFHFCLKNMWKRITMLILEILRVAARSLFLSQCLKRAEHSPTKTYWRWCFSNICTKIQISFVFPNYLQLYLHTVHRVFIFDNQIFFEMFGNLLKDFSCWIYDGYFWTFY